MKLYIFYALFFGYLNVVAFGTTDKILFTSAANLEESVINATKLEESFKNATDLEESPSNTTDLEKSSSNRTDLNVWKFFPYIIQNGTKTRLQQFKSKIKGGYNKVKNKINDFGNKGKNKIGTGNKSGYHRYRKPTGLNTYKTTYGASDITWIAFGVVFGVIAITVLVVSIYYCKK